MRNDFFPFVDDLISGDFFILGLGSFYQSYTTKNPMSIFFPGYIYRMQLTQLHAGENPYLNKNRVRVRAGAGTHTGSLVFNITWPSRERC